MEPELQFSAPMAAATADVWVFSFAAATLNAFNNLIHMSSLKES